jgi:mycofactocin precursor
MSERVGTAEVTDSSTEITSDSTASAELATADLLVEEVSIDGMCGVY